MSGWVIPPPSRSLKSDEDLRREREAKIGELGRRGLLRSERLRRAMLNVAREDFIPSAYRDHAYEEIPLPLPASGPRSRARTAIRCSMSRSAWESDTGSSRLAWARATARPWRGGWWVARVWSWPSTSTPPRSRSPARTWTGPAIPTWSSFTATAGLGYAEHAPYDRICVTAACPDIPPPLIEQLGARGRLIAPVLEGARQRLTLLEKTAAGVRRELLTDVLYVSLR